MAARKTFTDLAEFIGQVAAGRIPLTDLIEELADTLEDSAEPGFKRDKFVAHAEKQRHIEAMAAHAIMPGDTFTVDGLLLRADETGLLADAEGNPFVRIQTTVDSANEHDALLVFDLATGERV